MPSSTLAVVVVTGSVTCSRANPALLIVMATSSPSASVGLDHGGDRGWELLLGGRGGEQVDVFGRAIEKAVCLDRVAAGKAEPVRSGTGQRDSGQAQVEEIHRWSRSPITPRW